MPARRIVRLALLALGVFFAALGLWWTLQGTGLVTAGFMAHHMQWAWRGLALIAMGIALAVGGARLRA